MTKGPPGTELDAARAATDATARFDPLAGVPGPPPLYGLRPGGDFILDAPEVPPAVWGAGDQVLWSKGEGAMIFSPTGVGKTTLAQRLVLAALGIAEPPVLGYPVSRLEGPLLYLAADRPTQIARSFRRMVGPDDRDALNERLQIRPGPLPFLLNAEPTRLVTMAVNVGACAVVIDSLKDIAVDLSKDETGGRVNHAMQLLIAEGIELLVLHHPRKPTGDNRRPNTIGDVYGSTWLTAGLGSVVCLWGRGSDPIFEFSHLKTPAAEVSPFKVVIDHSAGTLAVHEGSDLLAIVRAGARGLTARQAAMALYGGDPDDAAVERARRQLKGLVNRGVAAEMASSDHREPTRFVAVTKRKEPA